MPMGGRLARGRGVGGWACGAVALTLTTWGLLCCVWCFVVAPVGGRVFVVWVGTSLTSPSLLPSGKREWLGAAAAWGPCMYVASSRAVCVLAAPVGPACHTSGIWVGTTLPSLWTCGRGWQGVPAIANCVTRAARLARLGLRLRRLQLLLLATRAARPSLALLRLHGVVVLVLPLLPPFIRYRGGSQYAPLRPAPSCRRVSTLGP